jgi:hypothetical protein
LKAIYVDKRKSFDREVQQCKRKYWFNMQEELLLESTKNQQQFWKKIGKIGVAENRKSIIPMEVIDDDGNVSSQLTEVLNKWKSAYSNLLNQQYSTTNETELTTNKNRSDTFNDFILTEPISFAETISVIEKAKKGQSAGYDDLPAEAFINNCSALFLHHLFDFCFRFQKIPDVCNKIVINPIPKANMADPRDPLCYRGIVLACVYYKLYCNNLNEMLAQWVDDNNLLADEQNGFRKGRSTIYQLSTLTNKDNNKITELRKILQSESQNS